MLLCVQSWTTLLLMAMFSTLVAVELARLHLLCLALYAPHLLWLVYAMTVTKLMWHINCNDNWMPDVEV